MPVNFDLQDAQGVLDNAARLSSVSRLESHPKPRRSTLHRRLIRLGVLRLLHQRRGLGLGSLLNSGLLPLRAALSHGRADGLGNVDVGVALERRVEVALYGERAIGVVAQHNMIDSAHAIAMRGHGQRRCEIVTVLIRCAPVLRIQPMHRALSLLVYRVAWMGGIGERWLRRMRRPMQRAQRLSAGDAIGRQVMRGLKLFDRGLSVRAEIAVQVKSVSVRIEQTKLNQLAL